MSQESDLPDTNDGWYKRLVMTSLDDLKNGYKELIRQQRDMHDTNVRRMDDIAKTLQEHEESDQNNFGKLDGKLQRLQTPARIVYGIVTMILVAFMAALITMVISKH